jgi:hypothetical protein
MYAWYWVADLCTKEQIPFVLGHALYLKLIYGAKAKNDQIDAGKIARLLRGAIRGILRFPEILPRRGGTRLGKIVATVPAAEYTSLAELSRRPRERSISGRSVQSQPQGE